MKEMKLPFIDSELLYIHMSLNTDSDLGIGLVNNNWIRWKWRICVILLNTNLITNLLELMFWKKNSLALQSTAYKLSQKMWWKKILTIDLYWIFSFICMFCRSLFVLLYFFFWPLCCLFFDIRFLIAPLVSSNFSFKGLGLPL